MDPVAYRRRVAVVFQDFGRYQFTVAENIDPSLLSGGSSDVVPAARRAGADAVARGLPAGYDTVLSRELADGVDLSGGQWQRVALARAFHRDAPLVVLDEPTAALDPEAEAALFGAVRGLLAGRTVLLVSHRVTSVRGADRIVVLDRGRVVETGDHETLMARAGPYARMVRRQAGASLTPAR
jgi:ATP-binding cassette, subfamily B, bacterial